MAALEQLIHYGGIAREVQRSGQPSKHSMEARCRHSTDSLHGRCTDCGRTLLEQGREIQVWIEIQSRVRARIGQPAKHEKVDLLTIAFPHLDMAAAGLMNIGGKA